MLLWSTRRCYCRPALLQIYARATSFFPAEEKKRLLPVIVWIHGGGFFMGSGSDFFYGPHRAMNQLIVLVTINYRLGPLGFISGDQCTANIGLHDQKCVHCTCYLITILFFST